MAIAKTKTTMVRNLLIEARTKKGLSMDDLAKLTGLDRSTIYLIEHNKRGGTFEIWLKIQQALSLKDRDMWTIINTTKRVNRKGF